METIQLHDPDNYKISETDIITRILGGEKELYEILVRRYNQKLYRAIRGYLVEEAEIEDAMQNAYVKAFTKLYQFKFNSSFSTWLIRIGINEALGRLKEKGRFFHINNSVAGQQANQILEIPDNKQLNPQDKMIKKEAKELLENAIDDLESKYRIVYILKEVEGMKLKDVADALDITLANTKVRLHRAKDMIKESLIELAHDKDVFEFGFSRCDRITENVMKRI